MKNPKLYLCLLISLCFIFSPLNAQGNSTLRIVSLGSTLTEELYLLGAQDKIVGVTIYCQRPAQAQTKEKIGGVTDVDLEKIIALKPSLVLATSLTNQKTVEKLKQLGIRVAVFTQPKSFTELCASFLELAKLVSRQAEAEQIIRLAEKKNLLD